MRETGASLNEILNMNCFVFFNISSSLESCIAEESLRALKINENKILLKNKETLNKHKELYNSYTKTFEKSCKTYHIKTNFSKLTELKNMLGGG